MYLSDLSRMVRMRMNVSVMARPCSRTVVENRGLCRHNTTHAMMLPTIPSIASGIEIAVSHTNLQSDQNIVHN